MLGIRRAKEEAPQAAEANGKVTVNTTFAAPRKPFYAKRLFFLTAAAVVALAVIAGGAYYFAHRSKSKTLTNACTSTAAGNLLQNAAPMLNDKTKDQSLQTIVGKIKNLPDYKKDPNCMYVLVSYDINVSDATSAQTDFNTLKKVYTSYKQLSPLLRTHALSISMLQTEITIMQQTQQQIQQTIQNEQSMNSALQKEQQAETPR